MKLLRPRHWQDYELLDAGEGEKLERFGKYTLARPEPQAVWKKGLGAEAWKKADARFVQEGSHSGKWEKRGNMPDQWFINYRNGELKLRFRLGLTGFKHVGIFPEQAVNWDFIYTNCTKLKRPKVLNLFAYTGGASLAAKAAHADVIHCDSIKNVINWAKANMEASKLKDIRWLLEDAYTFVRREAKRGNSYQGIILDPPAWGHGPKGEKWKLEDMVDDLIAGVAQILDPKGFLVLNSYSLGFSSLVLHNLVQAHIPNFDKKQVESGELFVPSKSGQRLPMGVFVRMR